MYKTLKMVLLFCKAVFTCVYEAIQQITIMKIYLWQLVESDNIKYCSFNIIMSLIILNYIYEYSNSNNAKNFFITLR